MAHPLQATAQSGIHSLAACSGTCGDLLSGPYHGEGDPRPREPSLSRRALRPALCCDADSHEDEAEDKTEGTPGDTALAAAILQSQACVAEGAGASHKHAAEPNPDSS